MHTQHQQQTRPVLAARHAPEFYILTRDGGWYLNGRSYHPPDEVVEEEKRKGTSHIMWNGRTAVGLPFALELGPYPQTAQIREHFAAQIAAEDAEVERLRALRYELAHRPMTSGEATATAIVGGIAVLGTFAAIIAALSDKKL